MCLLLSPVAKLLSTTRTATRKEGKKED
jgi:hypothetical protein